MQQAWEVWLFDEWLTTVYFDKDMSMPQVRNSLINHDGYSSAISVRKQGHNYTVRGNWNTKYE